MARKIHCSGCGKTETLSPQQKEGEKIRETTLIVDPKSARSWEANESYTEDLCEDCVKKIITSFFGIRGDILDPPILRVAGVAL